MATKKKTEETISDVVSEDVQNVSSELLKWYILSTYTGHESKVAEQIRQRVKSHGLEMRVVEVLVPTQEKTLAKSGKKRTTEEKYFQAMFSSI
jgi:transcriptional antiterminator NusG